MQSSPQDSYLEVQHTDSLAAHCSEFRTVSNLECLHLVKEPGVSVKLRCHLRHKYDREATTTVVSQFIHLQQQIWLLSTIWHDYRSLYQLNVQRKCISLQFTLGEAECPAVVNNVTSEEPVLEMYVWLAVLLVAFSFRNGKMWPSVI